MILKTAPSLPRRGSDFLRLCRAFPPRPIRSDRELAAAARVMDQLLDRKELNGDEQDYLDLLGDLVEKYEEQAHPIPPLSGRRMLLYLARERGLRQRDLVGVLGSRSAVSELFGGQRELNKRQIAALADFFGVSPAVFFDR